MVIIIIFERYVNEALDRVANEDKVSQVRNAKQLQKEDFHKEIFWG